MEYDNKAEYIGYTAIIDVLTAMNFVRFWFLLPLLQSGKTVHQSLIFICGPGEIESCATLRPFIDSRLIGGHRIRDRYTSIRLSVRSKT